MSRHGPKCQQGIWSDTLQVLGSKPAAAGVARPFMCANMPREPTREDDEGGGRQTSRGRNAMLVDDPEKLHEPNMS